MKKIITYALVIFFSISVNATNIDLKKSKDIYYYNSIYDGGALIIQRCFVGYPGTPYTNKTQSYINIGKRKTTILSESDLMFCRQARACNKDNRSMKCHVYKCNSESNKNKLSCNRSVN